MVSLSESIKRYVELYDFDESVALVADSALVTLHICARFAFIECSPPAKLTGISFQISYFLQFLHMGWALHFSKL